MTLLQIFGVASLIGLLILAGLATLGWWVFRS